MAAQERSRGLTAENWLSAILGQRIHPAGIQMALAENNGVQKGQL